MASKWEEIEAALAVEPETEEFPFGNGLTFRIGPICDFGILAGLGDTAAKRVTGSAIVPILSNGERITVTRPMAMAAEALCAGVAEPQLDFEKAVQLLHRFGGAANAMASRISELSGSQIEETVKATEERLDENPSSSPSSLSRSNTD